MKPETLLELKVSSFKFQVSATMFHTTKLIALIAFILAMAIIAPVSAQEKLAPETTAATDAVNLDENIQPQDLGINEPRILPGSPFYFFKNIGRGLTSAFTFDPFKKAELKLQFANERLMEAKKLAETKPEQTEILESALKNYEKETARLKKAAEKLEEKAEDPKINQFIDKLVDNQLKHQRIFGKFEKELASEIHEEIERAKEESAAGLSEIGLKVASPEELAQKMTKTVEQQSGSKFKHFKNLEVLKEIEAKAPEPAKEAIRQAQENSLKRLQNDLEAMSQEDREKFKEYVGNIGGNEVQHLQVLDVITAEELPTNVRQEIEKAKEKALERTENRLKKYKEEELVSAEQGFLKPLEESGQLEDLRIVKELENNLSPEAILQISPAKKALKEKIGKALEAATSPEVQKEFLDRIENKFYDVRQLEVLQEIEDVVRTSSKEFYEKMKEKTVQTMQQEIKKAEGAGGEAGALILERMAGNSPEQIKILEALPMPSPAIAPIIKKTIEAMEERVEFIEKPEKLEGFKQKLEAEEVKKAIPAARQPQLLKKIEKRLEGLKTTPPMPVPSAPSIPGPNKGEAVGEGEGGEAEPLEQRKIEPEETSPFLPDKTEKFVPPTIQQIEIEAVPLRPEQFKETLPKKQEKAPEREETDSNVK